MDIEKKMYKSNIMYYHPKLKNVFKSFANKYFPEFKYTEIQVNKSYPIIPHFDSGNKGYSILCSFGDYKNGETVIFNHNNNNSSMFDAREKPLLFNGR